ncbi:MULTISPECIES: DUF4390 domain-containing protein [Methylocaldum]|uniref:DUF4390 domain-containing protein n=1 Tax=unclassified Methylocaldum TaxID=2622260 RepID=UPI00098B6B50|nr:DUF4390 domain-containing protein [Methylocaldum sp. 14B]MBP1150147.1 hypothetical protein [Methylocaldum sp. RMAD-M]MDV3242092.1 DUF4390 domain-containing protein [Methylocaldum sp.]
MLQRLSQWSFLVGLLLAFDAVCADYGFRIIRAELVPSGTNFVLNADIDYRFSESALEALRHGVPLTLAVRLKIKRQRHYWLNETILSEIHKFRILYHPLGRSFQIIHAGGNTESFASLTALLEAMGAIRGWFMLPADRIVEGNSYEASLSVDLDIESLPLPLRPIAYVSPSWYLGSSWYRWRVAD